MFDQKLMQKLYRFSYCLTACPDAAYDLLQDALERYLTSSVHAGAERQGEGVNEAYLRAIIRNRQRDLWRKQASFPEQPLPEDGDGAVAVVDELIEDFSIDERLDLAKLFRTFAPVDREILFLWAYEGYSTSEIGQIMGIPRGTVLSRMHRIKRRMRTTPIALQYKTGTVKP